MEQNTNMPIKQDDSYQQLINSIATLMESARTHIALEVNTTMVDTYWHIGQYIVEFEQAGEARAKYGKGLINQLSRDLSSLYGSGFNRNNLQYMRKLYVVFPNRTTLSCKLTWSHYIEFLKIDDDMERSFYMRLCEKERWNTRELKRQMDSMLFHRIALSKEPSDVTALLQEGFHVQEPQDLLRDPYVLEFVNLPSNYVESELEEELINKFGEFLLEMGDGLCLRKRQYPIPMGGRVFRCDLVFYHAILKAYVLIDLKRGEIKHEDIGQMNFYLNYFRHEVCQPDDNPPIGIVLGAKKDDLVMQYALEGISNQLFAAKYQLYLPKREDLQKRLDLLLEEADKAKKESSSEEE